MRAMVLHAVGPVEGNPLREETRERPTPGGRQVLVRIDHCGVCRTDLHIVEGELPPVLPSVTPGHEIVGRVAAVGSAVKRFRDGDRVGIPWLHRTCGHCEYCTTGRENLCAEKQFTGYTVDGGYTEYALGEEEYVLPLPDRDAVGLAPFLCAGIIGYRALKLVLPRPGGRIGFFGFGASAHLTLQVAVKLGYQAVAYSRTPDHLRLARQLGAVETVLTSDPSWESRAASLDSAIDFAPAGETVPSALRELKKGGTLAIPAIHMSPIPALEYDRLLFGERRLLSVEANTREDAQEFLALAVRHRLQSTTVSRPLREANEALQDLKAGRITGAVVLDCA